MTCKVVALFCYTSLDISNWLLEKKTTIVGTINSNWKGVSALKTYNDRVNQNTKVFFGKKVQWTHNELWTQSHQKNAMCCCFQPPIGAVTKEHGKQKLAIIRFYDYTQGETDIVDQKMANYYVKPKSQNEPLLPFLTSLMLHVSMP